MFMAPGATMMLSRLFLSVDLRDAESSNGINGLYSIHPNESALVQRYGYGS